MANAVSKGKRDQFEDTALPHLNSAYNLARWLTRNEQDAEDVVQESYLRALRSFDSFQVGRDARAWLLKIVRNTYYTWLRQNRPQEVVTRLEKNAHQAVAGDADPETALIGKANAELIRRAIESISIEYREVFILRELEQLSYKEIAQIVGVPVGTVMSRLSRGRRELEICLRGSVGGTRK